MNDDIIQKLRDAPRQPDCKHGNRPKCCHECDIEELEAERAKLLEALTRIYTWYPISVSEPQKTIRAIQDFAFEAVIEFARASLKENNE